MQLTIYYDYLCEDSYQVFRWLERVAPLRPGLRFTWASFSLKELNRQPEEPSFLEGETARDPSVTALALAHAARQADFWTYHAQAFGAVHGEGRPLTAEAALEWARLAGVDLDEFRANEGRWIQEVAHDHEYGRRRWGVRSTPTLLINSQSVAMLKLAEPPQPDNRALELLDRFTLLLTDYPEVLTLRRPA